MKKNKLIGLAALMLSLGMVGCGEDGPKDPCEKHDWDKYVEVKAATCTEEGLQERTCKVCGEKESKKINKKSHSFAADPAKAEIPATCSAEGKKFEKCTVCGETKESSISKIAHTFGDTVWTTEANCTEGGVGVKTCTVCGATEDVTVDALGHTWADPVITKEATCTEAGVGTRECSVCHVTEDASPAALGHDIKLIGDDTPAPEGKAKVRLYSCAHECGTTYFGFKATETSPNSGELVEVEDATTGEIGKRFFGRPIGNNMELDETGASATGAAPEDLNAVFDETVQGDLFEYVFDLSEEQVAAIGETCLLYCDAKPADYLGGQDFWACDPSAEEWTRGMYIEGEKKGQPIDTYRYILYVDGNPVDFDDEMKAPVKSSSGGQSGGGADCPRGEFVMPYKFHLHKGENSISLRMAGGYRSVFYNFTFRPVEAEEPVGPGPVDPPVNPDQTDPIALQEASIVEKNSKPYLKVGGNCIVDAATVAAYTPYINFQNVGDWSNIGHDNNTPTDIPFEWDTTTAGKAYILIDLSELAVGANYNTHLNLVAKEKKDCKTEVVIKNSTKVGNAEYEIFSDPTQSASGNDGFWGNLGIRVKDASDFKATADKTATNADGKTVSQYSTELGTRQRIAINVKDYSSKTDGAISKEDASTVKLNKNGALTYKVNCDLPDTTNQCGQAQKQTVKATLLIGDKPSSGDHIKCHLFNDYFIPQEVLDAVPDIKGSTLGTPDTETQDSWRIHITVNGTEVPVTNYKTLAEMGLASGKVGYITVCEVTLVNGENTIEVKQGNIGYSFVFSGELRLEWAGSNTIVMDAPVE